ncbi:MAG: hypothetical protein LLF80_06140 [Porphyromonadaceae bacterium]|nr:hypothetical protein [Porphyromonadaceae bacterium]
MFRNNAKHPLIYDDIVANYTFTPGKTLGEMQNDIDTTYRAKVEAYGLADQGFFNDDRESNEQAENRLNEFFNNKKIQGKL